MRAVERISLAGPPNQLWELVTLPYRVGYRVGEEIQARGESIARRFGQKAGEEMRVKVAKVVIPAAIIVGALAVASWRR